LVALSCAAVGNQAYAEPPAKIELILKPKVCLLNSEEERCFDELHISWLADAMFNLCLFQKTEAVPLACWKNSRSGSHKMALNTNASLDFLLRDSEKNALLVSETFEVIHDHKRFRRARRNAWAFF
jgi:hypothetical protein